ncbi:hypothetical protein IW492_08655 [Enterococcus sp. BWB1-3]|uniref:hypothetical protein n=1 Tax=Enterococcus sp. BWB1-3 TaxID=2787713 RepID=UPI001924D142|nr:hypothetical protein [Enterococcus sp. BWB1-3]MBL1229299.1 hypothetical protein [Enterococcus sp. BWB1-3]
MSENFKEKETIYKLMREIIQERRELSKQYYELKERLEKLDQSSVHPIAYDHQPTENGTGLSILDKERIKQQDYYIKNNKSSHYVSYEQ